MHEALQAAVPGDSPRLILVGAGVDPATLGGIDWLVRRHGLELSAYAVQTLRFGSERLMSVTRSYPAPEAAAPAAPDVFAQVAHLAHSAPPPGV